jgi:ABC-type phosphate/phosphonate transport system substrate-binding protein
MTRPIIVGAVIYDPKVSIIWDIIRDYFEDSGVPMDVVFFTNYEQQVRAFCEGMLDMAWSSPLAWLQTKRLLNRTCRAIAMRDTDRDRVTHFVTSAEAGVDTLADLRGRTIALGAMDSPHAYLIPRAWLKRHDIDLDHDLFVQRFDVRLGKHGDNAAGELDAFRALQRGEAVACAMLDVNWEAWTKDGTIDPARYRIFSTTDPFDCCVFTVREGFPKRIEDAWLEVLFSMTYDNPKHREAMDMEGLRAWVPGRTTGFELLSEAIGATVFFGSN